MHLIKIKKSKVLCIRRCKCYGENGTEGDVGIVGEGGVFGLKQVAQEGPMEQLSFPQRPQ